MNNKKQALQSKKFLIKTFINTAITGLVFSSASVLAQTQALKTSAKEKPAYTLKIVTVEEDDNFSETGLETKKQTDLNIDAKLSAGSQDEIVESTEKHKVEINNTTNRSIRLTDGGVIWVSKDAASMTPKLDVSTSLTSEIENNKLVKPLSFTIKTNYAQFIDEWELVVYKSGDVKHLNPLATFMGKYLTGDRVIKWNGTTTKNDTLVSGDKLEYILTVKDKAGHIDETNSRTISLIGPARNLKLSEEVASSSNNLENNLARQTIPVNGSKVRIFGRDILAGQKIKIDNNTISLVEGKFVTEQILQDGKHQFDVEITDNESKIYKKSLSVNLKGKYLFMVGLADITLGEGEVTGNLESLSDGDKHLDGDIFVDGRLAFYLKGKIKGKYLVTAQMDTETVPIDELFDDIHKKDPQSLFRRLDPDKYYPVYGDDSTLIDDTDSQGKMYVRVDWDKSRAIWGNYNTDMTGTELSSFNRGLYGAKLNHKSTHVTKDGEHKTDVTVFASEAQSAFRHNQFLGTGGSLYYLKDKDIVDGSEKIWIEVRANGESERAVERIILEEGRDYQIDDFQGRIILNRPLLQIAKQDGPSLIKDTPLDGNQIYLMVDYEYVPDDFVSDKASYGTRGKVWINDHIAIGGTLAHENRENNDYDLKGVDITLQKAKGTYLKGEFAKSESNQTLGSFASNDGGLNFTSFNDNTATTEKGSAFSLEARANIKEFSKKDGSIGAWYKQREAGFSSASLNNGEEVTDLGVEGILEVSKKLNTSIRATSLEKKMNSKVSALSTQADYLMSDRATVSAEIRHVKETFEEDDTKDGEGTLGAFKVGYDLNKDINLYAIAQATLNKKGKYEDNNLFTFGTIAKVNNKLDISTEVSTGDRGDSALLGLQYALLEDHDVYINYTLSTDSTDDKRNLFTVGQRKSISDQLKVYTEHQYTHADKESGIGHTFGLEYALTKELNFNSSVQSAKLDKVEGGLTDRDAFSVGMNYKKNATKASMRIEYRKDKGSIEDTNQWVTTNSFNHRLSPSLRLQGKFNYSETEDNISNIRDAKFTEAGLGFAYRPVENDRLNVLGRITYLYDLQPISQSDSTDEKSLIASVESSYQLNHKWEVGGKLAHKESEIRTDRDDGGWYKNDATLAAVRVRYHLTHKWDALAQYHWMDSDSSKDNQHGAMISIDRHIGKNMKIGIGYNFTDFNDDLSDTEGSAKGWFINLVGKY